MQIEAVLRAKPARLITVSMTSTVMTAARLLRSENIGALVVKDTCLTEGDVILGMVSERDVVQAIADRGPTALTMPVSAVMVRNVCSCRSDDTVQQVCSMMGEHHVRHIPVLHGGALVGVVSIRDLLVLATVSKQADRGSTDGDMSVGHVPFQNGPKPVHVN